MMDRRTTLKLLAAAIGTGFVPLAVAQYAIPPVTVYKSATCGCCKEWVKHMQSNGFKVQAHDVPDLDAIKKQFGIAPQFSSCHTAKVGDYLVEGHVPAADIKRMLRERPAAKGLAVPGMPAGSPGMEGPTKERYASLLFYENGRARVFAEH